MNWIKGILRKEELVSDRMFAFGLALSVVFNIILWAVVAGKFGFPEEAVPLHFNVVYGVDFVGSGYLFYQLPLLGLIVLILNFYLARTQAAKARTDGQRLLSYFLVYAAFVVQLILLAAVAALLTVV